MANNYCDAIITSDIEIDCKNLNVRGLEKMAIIMNRDDIDFDKIEYNATRPNVVESLVMKAGKRGYRATVPTQQPFSGTGSTLGDGAVLKSINNTLGMLILANDPDVCANVIDGLLNGTFVAIVENKFKNMNKETTPGDSTFQIYGLQQGLVSTTLELDKYSADTNAGWNVVLTEEGATMSGIFLFDTDIATTRTLFESLTQPVGGGGGG